jgi:acetate---CoA ligase (ADP-forming)
VSALDALFAPRQVALLGVSRDPRKLGHVLLRNVVTAGFPGEIFLVNPAGEPILGLPARPRIADLPAGIDLALISLPAAAVLDAVKELGARRARAAVILTSGFGEVDALGRTAQAALLEAARASGIRLVGPNCMGVLSRPARLNGTYFWDLPEAPGHVGVISQSGAYGGLIMRHLGGQGVGVSRFLSIGNQVDVETAEALDYLAEDPETTVVACFIEAIQDGRRFVQAAARATRTKPVLVLKAGRTDAGRRAAGSHTGSLAGTAEAYRAAFARSGVLACAETEEFFDAIQAVATSPTRPDRPGLAVITVSGGPSVIAADAAEANGLPVPALPASVQTVLRGWLPAFAAVSNPVDMTPQVNPQQIKATCALVFGEAAIGGVLAVNVGLDIPEFADGLVSAGRSVAKPLVACVTDAPRVADTFKAAGVPVYSAPERAVRAYRALWRVSRPAVPSPPPAPRPRLRPDLIAQLESGEGPLGYEAARDLLAAYGLPFCRDRRAHSVEAARGAAQALGYPVVVKSARPDLLHKTEVGAVATNLKNADELESACRRLLAQSGEAGLLIQEHVTGGIEFLVGGRQDRTFGPMVVVGTGGVLAEAIGDVSVALAPVSLSEARTLVGLGVRGRLLSGYRGTPPTDPEAVARVLVAVGALLADHPRIAEVDVNPVILRGDRAVAVDALVIVSDADCGNPST